MKQAISPSGVFSANIKSLRKKDNRYHLILEVEADYPTTISIDVHDSICETAGISDISSDLKKKIFSNFPSTIKVSNLNGYWKIQNESQLLSDIISRLL